MRTIDLGEIFKTENCFLCGKEFEIDFNIVFHDNLYKAPLCLACMSECESDSYVLLKVLKRANELRKQSSLELPNPPEEKEA